MITQGIPGPKALELISRDDVVVSPSYPRGYPFVMDHGRGVEVWDVDGNRYLDFAAGIAVNSTGHSHPKVVEAIQEQAKKFIHISSDFYHQPWIELSEKLDEIAPFKELAVTFLTNSGTESVEAAIKLARYHTKRSQLIGFLGGFHGRTMGAVSLTASKSHYHRGFFPLLGGVIHVPYPNPYRPILHMQDGEDVGDSIIRYMEEEVLGKLVPAEDVAAILIEPIQGEGGYIVPSKNFFSTLRNLCDRHGILLIVDEVQSGMGRTGKWWAIENFGVEPDIVCSAKGIASGMPLGAMIARRSIVTWKKGAHGNTYGGNPISCVAALATLDLLQNEYLENARKMGDHAIQQLLKLKDKHPSIGEARGIGLMLGIEFVKDRTKKTPDDELRDRVVDRAFTQGLLTLGCGKSVIRISPPLCITRSELDEGISILDEAISFAEDKC
ncbi:MAG: acetyl ornithine aminotransferase family protein [Anaerolineae bacterium]|nr:acetyl ornithine aminotransferase family protein [Anaerolineae bacterium]